MWNIPWEPEKLSLVVAPPPFSYKEGKGGPNLKSISLQHFLKFPTYVYQFTQKEKRRPTTRDKFSADPSCTVLYIRCKLKFDRKND